MKRRSWAKVAGGDPPPLSKSGCLETNSLWRWNSTKTNSFCTTIVQSLVSTLMSQKHHSPFDPMQTPKVNGFSWQHPDYTMPHNIHKLCISFASVKLPESTESYFSTNRSRGSLPILRACPSWLCRRCLVPVFSSPHLVTPCLKNFKFKDFSAFSSLSHFTRGFKEPNQDFVIDIDPLP